MNPFGDVKLNMPSVVNFKPSVVEVEKKAVKVLKNIKIELSRKAKVLQQYNNIESDIPVNHPYWGMKG